MIRNIIRILVPNDACEVGGTGSQLGWPNEKVTKRGGPFASPRSKDSLARNVNALRVRCQLCTRLLLTNCLPFTHQGQAILGPHFDSVKQKVGDG
eukprot:397570-Pyramimonas_sp.AAC.1